MFSKVFNLLDGLIKKKKKYQCLSLTQDKLFGWNPNTGILKTAVNSNVKAGLGTAHWHPNVCPTLLMVARIGQLYGLTI